MEILVVKSTLASSGFCIVEVAEKGTGALEAKAVELGHLNSRG